MKKLFAITLCLLLPLSLLLACTHQQGNTPDTSTNEQTTMEPTVEETTPQAPDLAPESDFEYTVNSAQSGILISKYIGSSEHVVIPSTIEGLPVLSLRGVPNQQYPTAVDQGVFEGTGIKTIVIPETVQAIGYAAFRGCQELIRVTIVANSELTTISGSAFADCVNLETIDLTTTKVKLIDTMAFQGCASLKEIIFPNTLEEIHEKAFYECSALSEIALPDNLTVIQDASFAYCTSLKRITVPAKLNLTSLQEAILHNVPALTQIVFEDGREEITGYAFVQTDASVEIIVPQSVKQFSPLPFLIDPATSITITFKGNAPNIVDDDTDWFGDPTIYYDPTTDGWDIFTWNEKFEVIPIN